MELKHMKLNDSKGLTLIELLIAMAVFSIVSTAVYTVIERQAYMYSINEHVAAMNQNLRGAMYMMEREILMAGYSAGKSTEIRAGIHRANAKDLIFTYLSDTDGINNDNDGETDENDELITIQYSLYDSDGDGKADDIGRTVDNNSDPDRPTAPLAENVEEIEFVYTIKNGAGAAVTTTDPTFDQFDDIVFIDVSILARITKQDRTFNNAKTYETPSGDVWGPYNDGFRRRYVTKRIFCRNIQK